MTQLPSIIFTQAGYDDMQEKYSLLIVERKAAVGQLQKAREMGDLSENGFYKASRAKLSSIDHQLHRLKYLLRFGKVKEPTLSHSIDIGTTVVIEGNNKEQTIQLVGEHEANPSEGKISFRSPIGKALMAKTEGDQISVATPRGETAYKILQVKTA